MAFSASESAFEGFRIIRREPATMAVWGLLLLLITFASSAALMPVMRDFTSSITTGAAGNPSAQLANFAKLGQVELIVLPVYLALLSVFTAAVYRTVLRPEDKGLARLKLGADELRMAGLFVLLWLLAVAAGLAVILVAAVCVGGLALAFRSAPAAAAIGIIIIYLLVLAAYAWIGVRLSFAGPMTFTQRKIRVFAAWPLTKGRFWPLLGCYVLAWVFMILLVLVELVISGVLTLGASGGSFSRAATAMFRPDLASMNLLSPIYLVRLVVGAVFGVVMWTVALAAPAAAYKAIAAPRPEDQAETFS